MDLQLALQLVRILQQAMGEQRLNCQSWSSKNFTIYNNLEDSATSYGGAKVKLLKLVIKKFYDIQ